MKFSSLDIQNFLTIKSAHLQLADRGLNVIQGVNDADTSADSNGAGKSSIVDGLSWGLFGVTAREVKGDAVVNRTAKKDCVVTVTMLNGATEYRVVRHRKHKEFKNSLHLFTGERGASFTDLTRGTDAETQKEVDRVLGCSQEVFLAAIYSGQESMPDLPKMGDRDLKRIIEEAAGLQRIELAYEQARARRLEVVNLMTSSSTRVEGIKHDIAAGESKLYLKNNQLAEWDGERAFRVELAQKTVETALAEMDKLKHQLRDGKAAHTERTALMADIDVQLKDHSTLDAQARAAENQAVAAEGKVSRHLLTNARSVVATIEGQIANVDAEMGKPCDECGKAHTAGDREEYLSHRRVRLAEAQNNLKLVETRVREELAVATTARAASTAARLLVPDVTAVSGVRATLDAQSKRFNDVVALAHKQLAAVTGYRAELEARKTDPNPYAEVVNSLSEDIADKTSKLEELKATQETYRVRLAVADAVVKVFGPAGVRAHILDTVTPFLNDRTSDYLSALSDGAIQATWSTLTKGASGDLKEKFSIEVTSMTGGDSFLSLSGGEKRKVRLSTALALQDLVASRATQSIDLFIGDEISDALDAAGLERLMTVLERKARDRGTVLIISHDSLADWCDQVTTVRKKDGFSTVEGALCE
jgi:DNA repair exonuclease SbcCD ATPase subunit